MVNMTPSLSNIAYSYIGTTWQRVVSFPQNNMFDLMAVLGNSKFAQPFYFVSQYPEVTKGCVMLWSFFGTSHGKGKHNGACDLWWNEHYMHNNWTHMGTWCKMLKMWRIFFKQLKLVELFVPINCFKFPFEKGFWACQGGWCGLWRWMGNKEFDMYSKTPLCGILFCKGSNQIVYQEPFLLLWILSRWRLWELHFFTTC